MSIIIEEFECLKVLGQGAFGQVFKMRRNSDEMVMAMKKIVYRDMDCYMKTKIKEELFFMSSMNHPNIVKFYGYKTNKLKKTLFIFMEFCEKGDLAKYIKLCSENNLNFSEKYVWTVAYQVLTALVYLNKKNLLHRDLKPANVLLAKDYSVRVADFGVARIFSGNKESKMTCIGTPAYMAPEIISNEFYNQKADLYSLGLILHEMCQLFIFQFSKHMFDISPIYGWHLREFISSLLQIKVEERLFPFKALEELELLISKNKIRYFSNSKKVYLFM